MYFKKAERVSLLILLLIPTMCISSESKWLTVTPAEDTTIIITLKKEGSGVCKLCIKDKTKECMETLKLAKNIPVDLEITCDKGKPLLIPVLCVLIGVFTIFIILLLVVYIKLQKRRRELIPQVSANNSGNNYTQPQPSNPPAGCEDDEHFYSTIDESLIYSHLLRRQDGGIYEEYETYQSIATGCTRPGILQKDGGEPIFQTQQDPPSLNRPPSYLELLVDRPPTPGPRLQREEGGLNR